MLLVDDPDGLVMKAAKSGIVRTLYDAELVGGGGRVKGELVDAADALGAAVETFVKHFGGDIEYVHGADALKKDGHVGIEMRGIEKNEFFGAVVKHGVLPKKTFSMGEAEEKRYYIEARRIK